MVLSNVGPLEALVMIAAVTLLVGGVVFAVAKALDARRPG
jgi:hypothetical protein